MRAKLWGRWSARGEKDSVAFLSEPRAHICCFCGCRWPSICVGCGFPLDTNTYRPAQVGVGCGSCNVCVWGMQFKATVSGCLGGSVG